VYQKTADSSAPHSNASSKIEPTPTEFKMSNAIAMLKPQFQVVPSTTTNDTFVSV